MNCCDYNCNQGRNCPARVAKIGQRTPDRQPLPPMHWRSTMQRLATWLVYAILGMFWLAYVVAVVRWAYA